MVGRLLNSTTLERLNVDRKEINRHWARNATPDWGRSIAQFIFAGLDIGGIIPRGMNERANRIIASRLDSFVATHGPMAMGDTQEDQEKADQAWSDRAAPTIIDALVNESLISEVDVPRAIAIAAEEVLVWIRMEARPPAFYTPLAARE